MARPARPRRQVPGPWYATRRPRRPTPRAHAGTLADRRGRARGPDGRFLPVVEAVAPVATKDCIICAESKAPTDFPDMQISELCLHPPGVCFVCIQTSIRVDFSSRRWNQIHCPECRALLDYHHVRKYADEATFARQVIYISLVGCVCVSDWPAATNPCLCAPQLAKLRTLCGVRRVVAQARSTRPDETCLLYRVCNVATNSASLMEWPGTKASPAQTTMRFNKIPRIFDGRSTSTTRPSSGVREGLAENVSSKRRPIDFLHR